MWGRGLGSDAFSYGTLINALVKNGDMSDALKLFDEMPPRGMGPDVPSYNFLIDGCFRRGYLLSDNEIWEGISKGSSVYP